MSDTPTLWSLLKVHLPWISTVVVFLGGVWASLLGWTWRRNTNRIDDHGRRIGALERGKADREELRQLIEHQRQDTQIIHRKLDRLLERD